VRVPFPHALGYPVSVTNQALPSPKPTMLLWKRWKALARRVGNFQARLVLTIFYFTLAEPFGLGFRWFSDPLNLKRRPGSSGWIPRSARASDPAELRRQY